MAQDGVGVGNSSKSVGLKSSALEQPKYTDTTSVGSTSFVIHVNHVVADTNAGYYEDSFQIVILHLFTEKAGFSLRRVL